MTAIVYPASLPPPSRVPRRAAERRGLSTGPGPLQARAKSRDWLADHDIEFVYTPAEMAIFKDWWHDTLQYGGAWFAAHDWPSADPSVGGVYQFKGGVRTAHRGLGNQRVQVVAQERGRGVDPRQCFVEQFTAGLAPYSTVSGDAGIFSIVDGPSLAIAAHDASTVASIERALDEAIAVRRFTARFRVVSGAQPNDTPLVGLYAAGALKASFIARREGDFDVLRRCFASFDGENVAMSAAAIEIGVWHEARVEWAAGVGSTTYLLRRLDTGAVLGSGVFFGALAQPTVDALRFRADADPGVATCPIEYDDIEVCD
jgi:hypothetical protein